MKVEEIKIGQKVKVNRGYCGVPKNSHGYVVRHSAHYITVAWDFKKDPYPHHKTPEQIAKMWAADHECPLRNDFRYDELSALDVVE